MIIKSKNVISKIDRYRRDLIAELNTPVIGIALLIIMFLVGYLYRYAGSFSSDEGDKLAIGLLMQRGSLPYRDIFTHHFPFPYLWSFLVIKFFPSIHAVRIAVVLSYLLAFGIAMWITRYYLAIGILAVIWSIISHYYFANLAIYNTFSGIALIVVFIICVAVIRRDRPLLLREIIIIGIFSAIAVLSDPLAIFPVLITFMSLALVRLNLKQTSFTILLFIFFIGCLGFYLLSTSSVDDFYRDAIFFNSRIYPNYYNAKLTRLVDFPNLLIKGLWILAPQRWLQHDMIIPFEGFNNVQKFLIGGFIYRFTIISLGLLLLTRKKWLLAGFIYTFAAGTLIRSEGFFRQIPFVLVAIFCAQYLMINLSMEERYWTATRETQEHKKLWGYLYSVSHLVISVLLGLFFIWLSIYTLFSDLQKPRVFSYSKNLGAYETKTREIQELICGNEVALGVYPGDPLIYFYSGLPPISRYIYFWPWVAEIGLGDVFKDLQTGSAIVYIDKDTDVWGYQTNEYLAELISFLDEHYVPVGSFYLSAELAKTCNFPRTGLTK
jgi:hypothetical protein